MDWQALWICLDTDETTILSSVPIGFHKDEIGKNGRFRGITFNGRYRPKGRWIYKYSDHHDAGMLCIEFAAGYGSLRRHSFMQITEAEDVFELLKKEDPIYQNESLWSEGTMPHQNENTVFLQKWRRPNA